MADNCLFSEEDMAIDEAVGHPQAYAKLCRDRQAGLYTHGPPFTFTPYSLKKRETATAKELDQLFPIINPKAKPTAKPKLFGSLLWKQLNHLGNAGFDPAVIRVDHYGNVLYYHADSASPLAWDIDHWFPCSRGGLTVPSNLRILQWQACKRKHHKLEFLVPWWDFQLGISVNQFLSIFASSNSDFRRRAFSFLFFEGENEELNTSQTVESHSFPQHFVEAKERLGFAPAAIVLSRREFYDSSSPLRSLDYNRQPRPSIPIVAARKVKPELLKENENPDFVKNPYQAIVMARDSLRQRDERAKLKAEIQRVDDEVNDMKLNNEEEKLTIQELELKLIKHKRRAEKCRRLAEAQSSHKTMLEKMIRDTMHQSVIYKEQLRLNQAASNALMARLEAQKEICNAAEKDLYQKYRQRDELEKQLRPECDQARKRSRMDNMLLEETDYKAPTLFLQGIKPKTPTHKELRLFLEEEQRASECGLSQNGEQKQKESEVAMEKPGENENKAIVPLEEGSLITQRFENLEIGEAKRHDMLFPFMQESDVEKEDEESRKQRGKGNIEKWLQMLLDENQDTDPQNEDENRTSKTHEISTKPNVSSPQKEVKVITTTTEEQNKEETHDIEQTVEEKGRIVGTEGSKTEKEVSIEESEKNELSGKEIRFTRSDSGRIFRRIPSSPSLILGMKKGVDCMGKKPMVRGDDDADVEDHASKNSFIKSSIKTLKKAVRI
ncbi:titin homolog isoform X2 [Benincasa hispida]|uniref:titin homolog isoform X2 n=1 Tax=Benincasa hispida TaxID=102211 RepID=UPI0018FFD4D7|nr:titin homolog isoform X2 [Benincasa hispida]